MRIEDKRVINIRINYDHADNMYPAKAPSAAFPEGFPASRMSSDTIAREIVDTIREDKNVCHMIPKGLWGGGSIGSPDWHLYSKKIEYRSALVNYIKNTFKGRLTVDI